MRLDDVIKGSTKSEAIIKDLTRKFGEKLDDLLSKLLVSGHYREVLRGYIGEQYDEKSEKETPQYLSLYFIVEVLKKWWLVTAIRNNAYERNRTMGRKSECRTNEAK